MGYRDDGVCVNDWYCDMNSFFYCLCVNDGFGDYFGDCCGSFGGSEGD